MRASTLSTAALWLASLAAARSSELGQFALGKILYDSAEMFGDAQDSSSSLLSSRSPPPPPQWPLRCRSGYPGGNGTNSTVSRSDWMGALPDSTPLTALSIPGLHDAATWNYSLARQAELRPITDLTGVGAALKHPLEYRCQRLPMAAALAAGVRFFDLRYAFDPTETHLVFWHNEAFLSERSTVESVLFALWAWLDAHPSETLLLSFMYQGRTKPGASNSAAVQRELFRILDSPASRAYFAPQRASLPPSLGAARGKAVLLKRFDFDQLDDPAARDAALPGLHLSPALWTDNGRDFSIPYGSGPTGGAVYIEDYYEPDDLPNSANAVANIAAKLNATASHLQRAAAASGAEQDGLFITFASGGHLSSDPPVYPETMAIGNSTDTAVTPQGGVNQQLVPVLRGLGGKRKGIVVLDFFDTPDDLVDAVLGL